MKSRSAAINRRARAEAAATLRQRKNRFRRICMPVALIERPLRFIRSRTAITDRDGKVIGHAPECHYAEEAAAQGYGEGVRQVARHLLRAS